MIRNETSKGRDSDKNWYRFAGVTENELWK